VWVVECDQQTGVWKPFANNAHADHVVVMDQLLWRLPVAKLGGFLTVVRRGRGSCGPIASVALSVGGVEWAIEHGNLSHYGEA